MKDPNLQPGDREFFDSVDHSDSYDMPDSDKTPNPATIEMADQHLESQRPSSYKQTLTRIANGVGIAALAAIGVGAALNQVKWNDNGIANAKEVSMSTATEGANLDFFMKKRRLDVSIAPNKKNVIIGGVYSEPIKLVITDIDNPANVLEITTSHNSKGEIFAKDAFANSVGGIKIQAFSLRTGNEIDITNKPDKISDLLGPSELRTFDRPDQTVTADKNENTDEDTIRL
ncbi:hypothetical protein GF340_01355 [Candidatus Peregrinibacteria bacterium]|nr:hypothetical protein [Candidatus Peregrinibacteria bacterium]